MDLNRLLANLERPASKVDVVLDTDAYNEVDDQFAIAYMLAYPDRLSVQAIYAAPFHNGRSSGPKDGMEKSHAEILRLLAMIKGADGMKVLKGSERYLPDEATPVPSPAASHLVEAAMGHSPESPLYVVAIGAITNVASAILMEPRIAERVVVVWLGGNALHWPDAREFNMHQDIAAARVVFGCGAPLVQLPCGGVVSAFTISEAELSKWLLGRNAISDYLARNTIDEASKYAMGRPWTRIIWDVTAVAWLIDGRFQSDRLIRSPIPEYDGYMAHSDGRHFMRYVYAINRDALVHDLFERLLALG